MNRFRAPGLLAAFFLLVLSLVVMGQGYPVANGFLLLLMPLILLAGFMLGHAGALGAAVAASLTAAGAIGLGIISRETAAADTVAFFFTAGVAALIQMERELRHRGYAVELVPKQTDLSRVERKAQLIRAQIDETESRLKALIKLYEAAKKLSGVLDLAALLDEARSVVAAILANHFGPQAESEARLAFYIPNETNGDFMRVSARDHEVTDEGFAEKLTAADVRRMLGETISVVRVKDLGSTAGRFQTLVEDPAPKALVVVPLVTQEIVIGLMCLTSTQAGAFSSADFSKINVLGKQIVLSLRKSLLYRKVQTLSITDSQTGLYVHRHFQARLREEMHRAERYHQFLSVIMLDLDHFKQVNDQHGHQVGDAVLTETAAKIKEMAGEAAFIARYGGEEFAIILANTPKSKAFQIATLINEYVKAAPVEVSGTRIRVTVSGGISTYPEDALEREALVAAADAAMYEAKRQGRDQVVAFGEQMAKK